ncbi:Uncharacterised protein [Bacteroides xylanisolvens]|nr:Uncharacterised protein [Bacteroides xylanisolvens]
MKKGQQDRIAETLTRRLRVKKRLFFICSQKTPVKQMVTIREGCEGIPYSFVLKGYIHILTKTGM